jgi:molybdopterin-guanine dinucleotide biosynthesis protein
MKPFIVAITGAHSGCGKTFIAETVLRGIGLTCGAVKYTKTPLYASITDDKAVIGEEGTDTARMLGAGARSVQWVQSPEEDLEELLDMAVGRLGGCEVIIIEGNSPSRIISPDVVIFVFGDDPDIVKESALSCIEKADYMIYKDKPSIKTAAKMYNKYSDREMGQMIQDLKMKLKRGQ